MKDEGEEMKNEEMKRCFVF